MRTHEKTVFLTRLRCIHHATSHKQRASPSVEFIRNFVNVNSIRISGKGGAQRKHPSAGTPNRLPTVTDTFPDDGALKNPSKIGLSDTSDGFLQLFYTYPLSAIPPDPPLKIPKNPSVLSERLILLGFLSARLDKNPSEIRREVSGNRYGAPPSVVFSYY